MQNLWKNTGVCIDVWHGNCPLPDFRRAWRRRCFSPCTKWWWRFSTTPRQPNTFTNSLDRSFQNLSPSNLESTRGWTLWNNDDWPVDLCKYSKGVSNFQYFFEKPTSVAHVRSQTRQFPLPSVCRRPEKLTLYWQLGDQPGVPKNQWNPEDSIRARRPSFERGPPFPQKHTEITDQIRPVLCTMDYGILFFSIQDPVESKKGISTALLCGLGRRCHPYDRMILCIYISIYT